MSFSLEVKKEICKEMPLNVCCIRSELAGIVGFCGIIKEESLKIRSENIFVLERFSALVKSLYKIDVVIDLKDTNVFSAYIDSVESIKILRDLKLYDSPARIAKEIVLNDCCKGAFLRGAFLGAGSVTDPKKSYHIEFTTFRRSLCMDFIELLKYYEVKGKLIERNGNVVVYIKENEQISDILAAMGAFNSMMEFLNIKIEKELRNTTNRRANCEAANVIKTSDAALKQTMAIEKIKNKKGMGLLSEELSELAKLRILYPEMSLNDLAKKTGVTKSCVNHRMKRIIQISEEL